MLSSRVSQLSVMVTRGLSLAGGRVLSASVGSSGHGALAPVLLPSAMVTQPLQRGIRQGALLASSPQVRQGGAGSGEPLCVSFFQRGPTSEGSRLLPAESGGALGTFQKEATAVTYLCVCVGGGTGHRTPLLASH